MLEIIHYYYNKELLNINSHGTTNILTFDDKGLFTRKLIKCLIYPLKLLMKLRIKYGFYYFFIDLVLFIRIKKYVRNLSWFRTNILGNVEIRNIKSDAVFAERV